MTNVRIIRKHLEMIETILLNNLTEDSPRSAQPPHVNIPLLPHQCAGIESMRKKEIALQVGYRPPLSPQEIVYSKFAFLGDRAGMGKTLMVLGHISQMSTYPLTTPPVLQPNNLHEESTTGLFSVNLEPPTENLFDSLIVVPFSIYRQWYDTIKQSTSLKANFLKTQRDLDKDALLHNLRSSHLTLISNTLLNSFMKTLRLRGISNPKWRRVFYDEADTIKISSGCIHPQADMTWYVSSNYVNLVFADTHYSSYVFRQLPPPYIETLTPILQANVNYHIDHHPSIVFFKTESFLFFANHLKTKHPLKVHLVVMSSDAFIESSVQLPPLLSQIIRCQAPLSHDLVEYTIPQSIKEMLHAGDVKGALRGLGVPLHNSLTIVDAVTEYRKKEIQQLNRTLEIRNRDVPVNPAAVASIVEKIRAIEADILSIRVRLEQVSKEVCAICFDPPNTPVVTPCCSNVFCGTCMLEWMVRTPACPLCRVNIHPNQLANISIDAPIIQAPALPKKIDALLKILHENPTGRFLIFSRFDNPLAEIHETISEHYPSQTLQGNKDIIANQLTEFESGITKILLVNSHMSIAGMNLPTATHVILLHKMGMEEEKHILGRSYRLGRVSPLHYIKLLNERE